MLSIILPIYNDYANLISFLCKIKKNHIRILSRIEIVFVFKIYNDPSKELIKKINLPKYVIHSYPDNGIYEAMNQGIYKSTQEWLIFMGCDDYFCDDSLEKLLNKLEIVDCNVNMLYSDALIANSIQQSKFNWRLLFGNSVNHQNIVYRKSLIKNFLFDENYKIGADYKLNLMMYKNNIKCEKLNFCIANHGVLGISHRLVSLAYEEERKVRVDVFGALIGGILNIMKNVYRGLVTNCRG